MQVPDTEYKKILEAIDDLGSVVEQFKDKNDEQLGELKAGNASLRERMEAIESDGAAGYSRKLDRQESEYRVLHSEAGTAYAVSSKGRFSDIPALKKDCEVSMDRWFAAMVLGDACEDKEAREFAIEQKSLGTTTSGILLPEAFVNQWIDMVRAQTVLVRAGMVSVTMPAQTLVYSHQTADPAFSWRGSEGISLNANDPTFAARTLRARTVAVRTQVSLEAYQDVPMLGTQISNAYARAFAAAIDQAGLRGDTSSPMMIPGLQNTAGVGTVTSVGTPTNWDEVLDGVATFLNANNTLEDLTGIIMHPNIWKVFAKLKTGISSDNTPLELPPALADVPQFVTTNNDVVSSPADYHIELGNFRDYVMGVRMNPTVRILDATTSMASNLLVEILGVARVDFLATRPASFVVLEDVTD
jgi:HK97 family phage major capsid protein